MALGGGHFKVCIELADGTFTWHPLKAKTSEAKARDLSVSWSEEATRKGLRGGGGAAAAHGENDGERNDARPPHGTDAYGSRVPIYR